MKITTASGIPLMIVLIALKPQQLQLGFLEGVKGFHMMEMCREYGIVYKHRSLMRYFPLKWLDYEPRFEAENCGKYGGSVL